MLKKIIILAVIIIGVPILGLLLFCTLSAISENAYEEATKNIINKYSNNSKMFKDSMNELNSIISASSGQIDNIFIVKKNNNISIEVFYKNDTSSNGVSIVKIKNEQYIEYSKTLKLVKKTKISNVWAGNRNIEYMYSAPFPLRRGLSIVYLTDKEKISTEHTILKNKKLEENWYYMEID